MADPQIENGYTRLANELLEAIIAAPFSGQELRIVFAVARRTYGWNKIEDYISLSQFKEATGMTPIRCSQVVNRLAEIKVITVIDRCGPRGTKKYRLNKNYDEWTLSKKRHSQKNDSVRKTPRHYQKSENDSFTKVQEQKTLQKTYTKEKTFTSDSNEIRLAALLLNLILTQKPDLKKPNLQTWAQDVDRMIRLDSRTPERIEAVIRWVQQDQFWAGNVLSPRALRKHFDTLESRMRRPSAKGKSLQDAAKVQAAPDKYKNLGTTVEAE